MDAGNRQTDGQTGGRNSVISAGGGELSRVDEGGVSKSSLGQLVKTYEGKIVVQQQAEAGAMVKPPANDSEPAGRRGEGGLDFRF